MKEELGVPSYRGDVDEATRRRWGEMTCGAAATCGQADVISICENTKESHKSDTQ